MSRCLSQLKLQQTAVNSLYIKAFSVSPIMPKGVPSASRDAPGGCQKMTATEERGMRAGWRSGGIKELKATIGLIKHSAGAMREYK